MHTGCNYRHSGEVKVRKSDGSGNYQDGGTVGHCDSLSCTDVYLFNALKPCSGFIDLHPHTIL